MELKVEHAIWIHSRDPNSNPFNGIESLRLRLSSHVGHLRSMNPFNGIERTRGAPGARGHIRKRNPFNGIERSPHQLGAHQAVLLRIRSMELKAAVTVSATKITLPGQESVQWN